VINKVIDVRQSVFLEGKGLLDSVLVANEVLELRVFQGGLREGI